MKRKIIMVAVALLLVGGAVFAAFNYLGGMEVTVDAAAEHQVVRTVSGTGYFAASEERKVIARHSMVVQEVLVEEGQRVSEGEVLLRGDTDDLKVEKGSLLAEVEMLQTEISAGQASASAQKKSAESALSSAEENLQQALADVESLRRLHEQGAAARKDYEQARLAAEAAEARVQEAEAALQEVRRRESQLVAQRKQLEIISDRVEALRRKIQQHQLTAGGDMTVADVHVEVGDVVAAGTPLCLLHSDQFILEMDLLAQDAREVEEGQTVIISGEAVGDAEYRGTVRRLHPHAVEMVSDLGVRQRRVPAEITPDERPAGVRPGYPADVEIVVGQKTALAVDRDAVFSLDERDCVFLVRAGRAELTEVELGLRGDDLVIVTDGLQPGDEVVLNPPAQLEDGTRIRQR